MLRPESSAPGETRKICQIIEAAKRRGPQPSKNGGALTTYAGPIDRSQIGRAISSGINTGLQSLNQLFQRASS